MILFQDAFEEAQDLIEQLQEKIMLIRALGNFHIDSEFPAEYADLVNQRKQILKSIRQLETDLTKLSTAWRKTIEELKEQSSYEPASDAHADLVTKFVMTTVPISQRRSWKPATFTGSLLVFFVDGKIDSSELIERRPLSNTSEAVPPADKQPDKAGETGEETENSLERLVQDISDQEELQPHPTSTDAIEEAIRAVSEERDSFTVIKSGAGVTIYFRLWRPERISVKIYDVDHRPVRTITNDYPRPGEYSIRWEGLDDHGNILPQSKYFCQLVIGEAETELQAFQID